MERIWNAVHYFAYRAIYRFHLATEKINPLRRIIELPFIKSFYARKGVDLLRAVDEAWENPEYGLSLLWAWGAMLVVAAMPFLGLLYLYTAAFGNRLIGNFYVYMAIIATSVAVNHVLLFRHDKYLGYFKEFKKMTRRERRRWVWTSLFVILGILVFGIGSYLFMGFS